MTFRFKLFKTLTGINLFISGFFLMMALLSVLLMASLTEALIGLLILGAVCIHSYLSLYLQRSLADSSVMLKPNTPGGIRIMGWIAIIYGCSLIATCVLLLSDKQTTVEALVKQMPEEQRSAGVAMIGKMLVAFVTGFLLYGISIIVNCFLSFSFLKQWKRKQEEMPEEPKEDTGW